jgi:signal peptidase I
MKKFFSFVWEFLKIVVIAAVIVVPIRYFLFQPFFVRGESMKPSFENGDYLIVDEISYRFNNPQRGDVVVFKYPNDPSQRFIKRIIGLPGEVIDIKNGRVTVFKDGQKQTLNESEYLPADLSTQGSVHVVLKKDEYFVMGDNRPFSYDSRRFGKVPRRYIIGKVALKISPFASFAKFKIPVY